jgi:hypothetical protein
VTEIEDVVVARQATSPILGTTLAASVILLVAFLIGLAYGQVLSPLVVLAGGGLAIGAWWAVKRPRRYELWARYQGWQILVFSSPDAAKFGRVSRALKRALEARTTYF